MKFISLDVSTKSTGLAVFNNNKLESYKLITASSTNLVDRIQKITKEIQETIAENGEINKIILEEVLPDGTVATASVSTHRALMWAQAAINFMLHDHYPYIKTEYVYPGTWRKTCGIKTGRGVKRADVKLADIKFVKDTYGIEVNDDVADAICIGHHYILNNQGHNWA